MAYRILSIIQSFFITLCSISVLDFGLGMDTGNDLSFGFNELLFDSSDTAWWSYITFWAYNFFIVAILQLIKGIVVKNK